MSEYIERNALIKKIHHDYGFSEEWAKELAFSVPAADVAPAMSDEKLFKAIKQYDKYGEIIPCAECEHFYPFFDPPYGKCSRRHHDDEVVKYTDYCSYAKKKLPLPEFDDHTVSGLLDD